MKTDLDEKVMPKHTWLPLQSPMELEAWMEINNQELQNLIGTKPTVGHGICVGLLHGGEIYIHTNSDGDVLLDVTPEAEWVKPVIAACTRVDAPRGQIWCLPQHDLIPVLWGLNTLIETSHLVLNHAYRIQRW